MISVMARLSGPGATAPTTKVATVGALQDLPSKVRAVTVVVSVSTTGLLSTASSISNSGRTNMSEPLAEVFRT